MTLADYRGQLLVRKANYEAELKRKQTDVILLESDLRSARAAADTVNGALQATAQALEDLAPLLVKS